MASAREAGVVKVAAVGQGIALVTFPAASGVFTNASEYGIAAFGAGPLQAAGVELSDLFGFTAVLAVLMGGIAFVIARRRAEPAALHPRPV